MCLTIPAQIKKVQKRKALTTTEQTVDCSLVPVTKGDWVLLQNGYVLKKISPQQALSILNLIHPKI